MKDHKDALALLASVLRPSNEACPILLLGAGASFRSGVPMASEAIKQVARIVYSEHQLAGARSPERIKPSEWDPWLQSFPWFIKGAERFAENFPVVVEHLLTPAEFRKRVLLDLMRPTNGLSVGYTILSDFVLRGLVRTILTTNFDTCLPDALRQRQPHIRQVHEVNRWPGDYDQFSVFNRCQIVWLHGRAEHYSDKNQKGEVSSLDEALVSLLRPLLDASPIVVIGYRGAEPSIMEGLFGRKREGRLDFPNGIYWCLKAGDTPHPNVEALARRLGSNFRFLEIAGFDEVLADLSAELAGQDRYTNSIQSATGNPDDQAFDERIVANASIDDIDLDLALEILGEYCKKLGRALVTRETLFALMREQGLLIARDGTFDVTAGAILLFGKNPQHFFPYAVVSLTENGKKREVYDGNLIRQHRDLLARLDAADINPLLKVKKIRQHEEQTAYPPRVLVELLVNVLVHRDYAITQPSNIEVQSGEDITVHNPGGLTPKMARHVTVENDGRFTPEGSSDQRNPSLCDIFFGISAMERAGTGLVDVSELMQQSSGGAAFYHYALESRFCARISQPKASAGSRVIARSETATGIYILNAMPFKIIPDNVTIIRLTTRLKDRPRSVDLSNAGTFINRDAELWSFVPLQTLMPMLEPIVDAKASTTKTREEIQNSQNEKRVLSWLLRRHWERHLKCLETHGLILEGDGKHRAYFKGKDRGPRTITWTSAQRSGIRREVVKRRGEGAKIWFENEGFGYEIVEIGGHWCVRIKPFYMFTGADAYMPLPSFTRATRATSRMKFDRNRNVEADLSFWSTFLAQGTQTINVGQQHVDDLLVSASFLTVEVVEVRD